LGTSAFILFIQALRWMKRAMNTRISQGCQWRVNNDGSGLGWGEVHLD